MDVERKKNFINKDTSVSKANIKDILQNSNYIENYINYSLQDDENNLNVASKRKGSSEHKVGSGEINTQLMKTIEIYKNKNVEEKKCQNYIITKYENVLRNMKRKHINEISEIKNNVLQDVDFLIQ
ncbi:conserved Plasmodium protein, unknown function [Plasmodium malariae]|uniref:Uncharacterized protein n=1 Tax=Plasmodium malariae TaxID=5858 RepID=A0A1A8WZ37_PLAMA|nr:conserved Plasmodium protein, unknown function [Plasmodium malariae]